MRLLVCLGLLILVGLMGASPARAETPLPDAVRAVAPLTDDLLGVHLICPAGSDAGGLTIVAGDTPLAVTVEPLAHPTALVIVLETSAAMNEAGPLFSTPHRDASTQIAALFSWLEPGDRVALVTVADRARVLTPLGGVGRARMALADAPTAVEQRASDAPAEALALAEELLAGVDEARPLVVVIANGDLDAFAAQAPTVPTVLVDLAAHKQEPSHREPNDRHLQFGVAEAAELPARFEAAEALYATHLGERAFRLMFAPPPGTTEVTITGCGDPFGLPPANRSSAAHGFSPLLFGLGAVILLILPPVMLGAMRRRGKVADATGGAEEITAGRVAATTGGVRYRAVVEEAGAGRAVPLEGRLWTIGSASTCTIALNGPGVEALHARIALAGTELIVTDLSSSGSTWIGAGQRRVLPNQATPLDFGAPVRIGTATVLRIVREAADEQR